MLINQDTGTYISILFTTGIVADFSQAVYTSAVILVPYERSHVPTYHEWMKDEVLYDVLIYSEQ
jgi:hypothetical protein